MSQPDAKPRFRIIAGRPISVDPMASKVAAARRRFGKPFAHEHGSTWAPRETPLLAEWIAGRIKERG